jgi:hypothetical protein
MSKYIGPLALVQDSDSFVLNIKCDWTDPLNPEKNNVILDRRPKDAYNNEIYRVSLRTEFSRYGTEFATGPCTIFCAMIAPVGNLKRDYPTASDKMTKDGSKPEDIQQSFFFTGDAFHPDLVDPADKSQRSFIFTDTVNKYRELEKWVAACLIKDNARLKWSKYRQFVSDKNTFEENVASVLGGAPPIVPMKYKTGYGELLPPPEARRDLEPLPFSEILSFQSRAFYKPKELSEIPMPAHDPYLLEQYKKGYAYSKMRMETLAEDEKGSVYNFPIDDPERMKELSANGNIFIVYHHIDFTVKSKSFNPTMRVNRILYCGPPPIPRTIGIRSIVPDRKVVQLMKSTGFKFPRVVNVDGKLDVNVSHLYTGDQPTQGLLTYPEDDQIFHAEHAQVEEEEDKLRDEEIDSPQLSCTKRKLEEIDESPPKVGKVLVSEVDV